MVRLDYQTDERKVPSVLRDKVKGQNPERTKFMREGVAKYSGYNEWLNLPNSYHEGNKMVS